MELSHIYLIKPNQMFSPLTNPNSKFSPFSSPKGQTSKKCFSLSKKPSKSTTVRIGCTELGPMKELDQEDDEWAGIEERWREKCRGEGIIEVMECLEREAIMGEDHGREASDYNRRARIFDKSNRVFQVLKAKESNSQMLIS